MAKEQWELELDQMVRAKVGKVMDEIQGMKLSIPQIAAELNVDADIVYSWRKGEFLPSLRNWFRLVALRDARKGEAVTPEALAA